MNNTIKGILILVEYDHGNYPNKIGDICKFPYGLNIAAKYDMGYPVIRPYVISETEKIEVGDWYITFENNEFRTVIGQPRKCEDSNYSFEYCKKILALPEHFSPQELMMIVDSKLKDRDIVSIKTIKVESNKGCGDFGCTCGSCTPSYSKVKLDPYISIHKIEQPKFTEEEIADYLYKRFTRATPIDYIISELRKGDLNHWYKNK